MKQKQSVLEKRYFRAEEVDEKDLFRRVADFLGNNKKERDKFFKIMKEHKFMPNTPCLVNAGVPESSGQLFACFVVPIEDSMEGIFDGIKSMALIQKTGGGTGFNFSNLRPSNSKVKSTNGISSGPISFMRAYDAATETIKQGGVRRGANMACFSIHHPDVIEFIKCKDDLSQFQNFNISVALDDEFIEAVKGDKEWEFSFEGNKLGIGTNAKQLMDDIVEQAWKNGEPGVIFLDEINRKHSLPDIIETTNPCVTEDTLIETRNGKAHIVEYLNMDVEIWNGYEWSIVTPTRTSESESIVEIVVDMGDDFGYVIKSLKCTHYHKFILQDGTSKRAIELKKGDILKKWNTPEGISIEDAAVTDIILHNDKQAVYCFNEPKNHTAMFNDITTGQCGEQPLLPFESCCLGSINLSKFVYPDYSFNYAEFKDVIYLGVLCLNRMIDKNNYPLAEIREISSKHRKIGLGIMGYADMLIKMGLRYGSEQALNMTDTIASTFQQAAHAASAHLAESDGVFSSWNTSSFAKDNIKMRNATVTTIAPTGTISIISECSSGIEPIYAPLFISRAVDSEFLEIHPLFEEMLKDKGVYDKFIEQFDASRRTRGLNDPIIEEPNLKDYLPKIADCIILTHEVTPEEHIKTQAVWQKYTDNAVSKTINLSNDATKEDVYSAYMLAHELKCKGLTVYRDGSRMLQPLSKIGVAEPRELQRGDVAPSNDKAIGRKRKLKTGCGNLHVQAWFDPDTGALQEVFASKGSEGGCNSNLSGLSRVSSWGSRLGGNIDDLVEQLESSLECASYQVRRAKRGDVSAGTSCPSAMAKALVDMFREVQLTLNTGIDIRIETKSGECPHCDGKVRHEGGCTICLDCSYSSCG
jgi:ribonucleoside-diphosphate reductase alpha chain